ncbi:MAG: NAD(P)-dependent oxidoreductase [Chthoniobacteraceae bacterium]|jgi:D-lactate dehydrogenase
MKISFIETGSAEEAFFKEELSDHEIEFCSAIEDCAADTEALSIFIDSKIDAGFLARHPNARLIVTRSTTHEHIHLAACARRGVIVCNVGGTYGDNTVPEHIFALMLAICRKLRVAMEVGSQRRFSYEALRGIELHGKTLGVVGTGRIGRQVLRLAKAFGMETIGCDSHPDPEAAESLGFRYVTFSRMLRLADFISINVPLTPSTFHLFNRDTFARCRRGLILINTARGPVIDSDALIDALESGVVAGAGLDVLEDERVMRKKAAYILAEQIVERLHDSFAAIEPLASDPRRISEVRSIMHNNTLLQHPNVIATPHVAFNSFEAIARINQTTVENIHAFLAGNPQNLVGPRPAARSAPRATHRKPQTLCT